MLKTTAPRPKKWSEQVTRFINKNGSKGQLLNIETEVPPQPTSKTSSDSNATAISIPDSTEKVNT